MTTINGTSVTHTHGDTLYLTFSILNQDGTAYVFDQEDTLTFLLRKESGENPVVTKSIPTDTLMLTLTAQETAQLDSGSINGNYVYDVKLTTASGVVDTVINLGELHINEEV